MIDSPVLLHLHIPKTGGSSLITLLEREYGDRYIRVPNWGQETLSEWKTDWGKPEDVRTMSCISGHFYFGFWRALNQVLPTAQCICNPTFITFIRHPVDRLLSLYHYWRTEPNRHKNVLSTMSFSDFVRSDRLDWQFLDNDMVRRIAGVEGVDGYVGDRELEQAIDHLCYFPLVGLTDRFDDTIDRWSKMFGWEDTEYTLRLDQPDRLQREELDKDLVAEIEDTQEFDCELYQYVLARDWGNDIPTTV